MICRANADGLVERKRTPRHAVGQRVPLDQFEHQGRHAVELLQRVNRRDMRVIEGREQLRLALETRPTVGIRPDERRQNLDGDIAMQRRIASAIHLTHPAGAERRHDGIRANLPAHRREPTCERGRGNVERGCLDEVLSVFRMRQQLFHLPAQCLVFGAGVGEECCTLRGSR